MHIYKFLFIRCFLISLIFSSGSFSFSQPLIRSIVIINKVVAAWISWEMDNRKQATTAVCFAVLTVEAKY